MIDKPRARIILHGAAVLLLGLLCGLPAVAEELAGTHPQAWRAAHSALLLAGVWLLATGGVLPFLVLEQTDKVALAWSLLATAYAFTAAVLLQAATGVRAVGPGGSALSWFIFAANVVAVLGGLLSALLTLKGARAALKSGAGNPGSPQ